MIRRFILGVLCTLLCLTVGLQLVHANESKVDKTKYITLTVKQGQTIKLGFAAPTSGVWVKVTGVKNEKVEEAPTTLPNWDQQNKYEATGTEITVYGAIEKFMCNSNDENLTALDVSQNVNLTKLVCYINRLSSLDVSQNVNLTELSCTSNQLSSLDVSQNVNLTELYCGTNQLSSLDVRQNVNLTELGCSFNQLSSLDVRQNVNLTELYCGANQLSSLDVSQNPQLERIWIYDNNFSTSTLNNLYCQLPDRSGKGRGVIYPVRKKGYVLEDELLAQSSSNTITGAKNWAVQYRDDGSDIDGITGNYTCGSSYGLTLAPATIPISFTYKGGEWKTTVTSTGNWKIDESTHPNWLSVNPMQGNSGTQVTVTANLNTGSDRHRGAITFFLSDAPTTKQVVLVGQDSKPPLVVTPAEGYTFPASGETKENYFTVESTGAWKVTSSNAAWFPVETKEGAAGTTQITITAEANSNREERQTVLTFALKDKPNVKQVVTLKQKGASLSVTPTEEYTFPAYGETKENYFTVESTGAWEVTSSNADWCPVEIKEGAAGTTQVTIKTERNYSTKDRKTELTFALQANAEVKQVVTLKQSGASLSVTPAEGYTFPASGETKANYFTVESKEAWKVTSSNTDWFPVETREGVAGTTQVTIKSDANNSKEERQTELTFELKANAEVKQVVTLKQKGASLSVTPAEGYTFLAAGETKANFFTVESTGAWKVTSSNAAWFPVETKEGEVGTTQVTIKAEANNSKEARTTELTFALKDKPEIKQVVTLKQKGASLSVTPAEGYTFPASGETKANFFTIESSGIWTVTSSNAAWFPVETKEGEAGTTQVTIKAEANNSKEARTTELTFALKANAEVKQVVTLKQAGQPTAVESVLLAGISVAPNPFSSLLKIKNEAAINTRYELVNTNGVVVRAGALQGKETVLNTEELKAGVYLLRILSDNASKTLQVVKE